MGELPLRPCPAPHCGRLLREGEACLVHRRKSPRVRGYDAEWDRYSRAWLKRFPFCGQRQDGELHAEHSRCAQAGRQVRATITDHIVPIREGGPRLDPANHQSLCVRCNTLKG
jgi:5-methylcytosine-specific restriction protein A